MEEQNPRLTTGTTAVFHSWLLTSGQTLFLSLYTLFTQGMSRKNKRVTSG